MNDSDVPVQQLYLSLQIQNTREDLVRQTSLDVASDFVSGFAFGKAIGVGVQSLDGWWTVSGLEMTNHIPVIIPRFLFCSLFRTQLQKIRA